MKNKEYKDYAYYQFYDKDGFLKGLENKIVVFAFRWNGYNKHKKQETYNCKIRRYRFKKDQDSLDLCLDCKKPLLDHGLICISDFEGDKLFSKICPGNWILSHKNEIWPCPHSLFKRIYVYKS